MAQREVQGTRRGTRDRGREGPADRLVPDDHPREHARDLHRGDRRAGAGAAAAPVRRGRTRESRGAGRASARLARHGAGPDEVVRGPGAARDRARQRRAPGPAGGRGRPAARRRHARGVGVARVQWLRPAAGGDAVRAADSEHRHRGRSWRAALGRARSVRGFGPAAVLTSDGHADEACHWNTPSTGSDWSPQTRTSMHRCLPHRDRLRVPDGAPRTGGSRSSSTRPHSPPATCRPGTTRHDPADRSTPARPCPDFRSS